MAIPAILLILVCMFGILICILQAFGLLGVAGIDLSSKYLINVLTSNDFIKTLLYTFYISFVEAIISLIIGFVISIYLIKNNIGKISILHIPITIPHIVVAMFTILLFAQNGFMPHIGHNLGIINNSYDFISIINDQYGIGIIIAYIWKSTAYVISIVYVILRNYNNDYYEVSYSLNSSYKNYVFDVILPLTKNTLIFCFMVIFSYSFGAYELPYLLGSTSNRTLPVLSYLEYISPELSGRVTSQCYNLVMISIGFIFIIIYSKVITSYNEDKYSLS